MKVQTFHDLLIGGLCIAATLLAAVTYNHHQQLAAMVAIAAQAQPDPAPALRRDLDLLREGQAKLQAQMHDMTSQQQAVAASQAATQQQFDRLRAAVAEQSRSTANAPSSEVFAAWQQRLDKAEGELAHVQAQLAAKAQPRPRAEPAPMPKPRVKASPPAEPPLSVLGIETRGGARFVSVLPTGARSLSAVQLLQPGESLDGWQLREIQRDQAVFQVAGHADRSLPLP
ncbi:hypothetical protein [Pseudomonas eucalypticola]|uniref:Methyl-accepting chemotaxis protein n=1 Tax=Pseudomonas eucalypticola TaxID=2599595 RepID=A0A7D5D6M5_9PSED|nr:hypothetical protein [Pseudomonas eucalypticola]QKZ04197.1 hypothetical protein HWQ56_10545 [Pseudomonas eucalypticola]